METSYLRYHIKYQVKWSFHGYSSFSNFNFMLIYLACRQLCLCFPIKVIILRSDMKHALMQFLYIKMKKNSWTCNSKRPKNFISFTRGSVQVIVRSHRLPGWNFARSQPRGAKQVSQSKHLIRKTKWEEAKDKKYPRRNLLLFERIFYE